MEYNYLDSVAIRNEIGGVKGYGTIHFKAVLNPCEFLCPGVECEPSTLKFLGLCREFVVDGFLHASGLNELRGGKDGKHRRPDEKN